MKRKLFKLRDALRWRAGQKERDEDREHDGRVSITTNRL